MILPSRSRLTSAAVALLLPTFLFGSPSRALAEDLEETYGVDQVLSAVIKYCRAQKAPNARQLQTAYQAWRAREGIPSVFSRMRLSPGERAELNNEVRSKTIAAIKDIRSEGIQAGCAELMEELTEELDEAQSEELPAPHELPRASTPRSPTHHGSTGDRGNMGDQPARQPAQSAGARTVGTLYTVAQFSTVLEQWRSREDRSEWASRAGRFYVEGTVVRATNGAYYLAHDEGGSDTTVSISLDDLPLSALVGRNVVVSGVLCLEGGFPGLVANFDDLAVVRDPSRLARSTIAVTASRRGVTSDVIASASDHGVQSRSTTGATNGGASRGATSSNIEMVLTVSAQTMGVGGFLSTYYYPVVLFKGGWVSDEIEVLDPGMDLAQHRARYPKHWWKWRPAQGRGGWHYEQEDGKGGWSGFGSGAEYGPLPRGFTLDGYYSNTSGGGDTAFGGTTAAIRVSGYTFGSNRTFSRGAATSISSYNAAAGGSSPTERGTYQIEGYLLTLRLANGKVETHSIVGMEGVGLIYIDGVSYSNGKY